MLKIFKFIAIFVSILMTSTGIWAKTMLVLDMRNSPELPKKFRTTSDTLPQNINTLGLADLHIAGSAQFSKASIEKILFKLHSQNLIVIDLRQESHGMLDGNAISWYAKRNAGNVGKTPAEIEEDQSKLLVDLGEEEIVTANKILKKSDDGSIEKVKPIEYLVHQTNTEEEFVTNRKLKYKRLYVQDFHAPSDSEVDKFLAIVHNFPKERWIYFHCRGGSGRTTVFFNMYDMLYNAKKVSFDDILDRQAALGGKDLRILPDRHDFKYQPALERLNFVKKFYEYAKDNKDHYKTTWTQWLEMKH